jgi:hypothetical protein
MPRYFFDVKDGHRLFDSAGFVCDNDTDAIIRAGVLAIGVSVDKPEDDPERRIAIITDKPACADLFFRCLPSTAARRS